MIKIHKSTINKKKKIVKKLIKKKKINISYHWQVNQGRFAAYNNARKYFEGELVCFLDSDDVYVENCIERIINTWINILNKSNYGGILANLMGYDGQVVGSKFPDNIESERIYILYDKYRVSGDKLIILRKDLAQKYSYPIFENERFGGDSIVFDKVSDEHPMFLLNEELGYREYLPDSITSNLKIHHLKSKNGIREHYLNMLIHEKYNKINIIKHTIGFIAYSKLTGKDSHYIFHEAPYKITTFILYFVGIMYCGKLKKIAKKENVVL